MALDEELLEDCRVIIAINGYMVACNVLLTIIHCYHLVIYHILHLLYLEKLPIHVHCHPTQAHSFVEDSQSAHLTSMFAYKSN